MGGQDHCARPVDDAISWVGGNVVKQLINGLHYSGSCFELLGTESAQGGKKILSTA